MIAVDRITARAVAVMGLQDHPGFENSHALAALSLVLIDLSMHTPGPNAITTVVTVEDQSEYELPESVAQIEMLDWPDEWTYDIQYVPIQSIRTFRQEIEANEIETDSAQPEWWSYYQRQSGNKHVLMLENAQSIAAGLTIPVYYTLIDGAEIRPGTQLAWPITYLPVLIAGVKHQLAQQYDKERVREFLAEYEGLKERWMLHMNNPTNEQMVRPIIQF